MNCLPDNDLRWALGSLGPAARLQEPGLPDSRQALTPGSGLTASEWARASVFGTLILPTSEPALAPASLGSITRHFTTTPHWTAASKVYTRQGLATNQTRDRPSFLHTHTPCHKRRTQAALSGGTSSLGDNRGVYCLDAIQRLLQGQAMLTDLLYA